MVPWRGVFLWLRVLVELQEWMHEAPQIGRNYGIHTGFTMIDLMYTAFFDSK